MAQFKGGIKAHLPTLSAEEVPVIDFKSRDKIRTLMEDLVRMTLLGQIPAPVARAAKGLLDSNTAFEQLTLNARVLRLEEALREEFDIDLPTHEE